VANIFISYRREDSGGHAGRLCDRLTARFGNARVFMDLQDIAPGQNFAQSIDEMIARCDCVIAVIGPRWVESIQRRAPGAEDFVQREIAAALNRGITVIPVLVGGARMPPAEHFPPALEALRYRNAFEVRDERFDDDVTRLGDSIRAQGLGDGGLNGTGRHSHTRRAALIAVAGLVAVAAVAGGYRLLRPAETATTTAPVPTTTAPVATTAPVVPAPSLDGDWIAEIQKEGQPPFGIRLTFVVAGDSITGMARYPTGDAPIVDARLAGRVLTFHTSHVPQFESTPAIIRYQAEVGDDEIRFTITDDYGIGKGVARRRPPSP
jgi:hypothetical protein